MTTESRLSLFSDPSNNATLRRLALEIESRSEDLLKPEGLSQTLVQIINLMIANPEKFDEFASMNVEWIGQNFIGEISTYLSSRPEKRLNLVTSIFTSAYRFICELEFTQPGESSFEVRNIMNFVHRNLEYFDGKDRQQLVYAAYTMPAQVSKRLIGHPSIAAFRNFSETVETSRKLKEAWDEDVGTRHILLQGLADNLKRLTSEYNFVGLVDGFKRLGTSKKFERKVAFWALLAIGILMLAIPALQVCFVIIRLEELEKHRTTLIYSLPAIITIEVILLYFFRVVLTQFRSVNAQLLQIDLRISLCQFIESYADYVSRLREKDSSALGKFETLIFSGLMTDQSGIPSTFDGVEQIASLVRSLRGGLKE